jgi:hypothetical protein
LEDKKHMMEGPSSWSAVKAKLKPATMRPIPHSRKQQMHPFMGFPETSLHETSIVKPSLPAAPTVKHNSVSSATTTHRKSTSGPSHTPSVIQLNPLPMKKHGCDRLPIQVCSEVHFNLHES